MISPFRSSWFHFFRKTGFCDVKSDFESERASVTIKVEGEDQTFESLRCAQEAEDFSVALIYAKEADIVIKGIEGRDNLTEKSLAAVYWNTVTSFPDGDDKRSFLVLVLWKMQEHFRSHCVNSELYCLNRIREIAPTSFDIAKIWLLAQCDPHSPDMFVPSQNADRCIVSNAIRLLMVEKNGKRGEADAILQQLEETGRYRIRLREVPSPGPYQRYFPGGLIPPDLRNK
jgi:hypothetical protein